MSRIIQRGFLAALLVGVLAVPRGCERGSEPLGDRAALAVLPESERAGRARPFRLGARIGVRMRTAVSPVACTRAAPVRRSAANGSSNAVSQYDVACYQASQH